MCFTILGPNYCLLRPSHLHCASLALLASLCALPSSLLGADPFLHHPARLPFPLWLALSQGPTLFYTIPPVHKPNLYLLSCSLSLPHKLSSINCYRSTSVQCTHLVRGVAAAAVSSMLLLLGCLLFLFSTESNFVLLVYNPLIAIQQISLSPAGRCIRSIASS